MRSRFCLSGRIVANRMRLPQRGHTTVGIGNFRSAGRAFNTISPYRGKPSGRRTEPLSRCAQWTRIFRPDCTICQIILPGARDAAKSSSPRAAIND